VTDGEEVDTTNYQLVGSKGGRVVVARPLIEMNREQAVLHAAGLVAVSGSEPEEFLRVLEAVQNT
jgi:hypothetical protein